MSAAEARRPVPMRFAARSDEGGVPLGAVAEALSSANEDLLRDRQRSHGRMVLPARAAIATIAADLRSVLFPGHFGTADLSDEGIRYYIGHVLDATLPALEEQVRRCLWFACAAERAEGQGEPCVDRAASITRRFIERLPAVRELLGRDLDAAYQGDPAATSREEALFCYPGVTALIYYRMAHELYALGVPILPRIVCEIAHSDTGIDIHPGARIGGSFFIDHGVGVVIGATCVIGERVRLYQGVTLGAKSFPLDAQGHPIKGLPRHPIVEDDVVIYAGATILGRVTIGRGSSIGGNVWLTHSVPPGSRVTQAQPREDSFEGGSGI